MLDVGFVELLVIGVVALLVLGPERLPAAARTVGAGAGTHGVTQPARSAPGMMTAPRPRPPPRPAGRQIDLGRGFLQLGEESEADRR